VEMMLVDEPNGACEVYLDVRDGAGLHLGQTWSCSGSMFVKRRRRGEINRRRMLEEDKSVYHAVVRLVVFIWREGKSMRRAKTARR
jgi:hypothetical protein